MRRAALALSLAVLLVPAVVALADADLARLVDDLGSQDNARRVAAFNALREAKDERAVPLLLDRLPGLDLPGQQYGVMILEAYPPKIGKQVFPRLLAMASPYLRLCGGLALYRMGDKRGVPAVVEALQAEDADLVTRSYMLSRLYDVREPRVVAVLEGMLRPGVEASLLGSVLWALQANTPPSTLEACRRLYAEDDRPDARFLTAIFLFRAGDLARADDAAAALRTGRVTSAAFSRLQSFLLTARLSAPPALLDAATELVTPDADVGLLQGLIRFLASAGHRAAIPRIQKLLGHPSSFVAKAAFEALAELGAGIDPATLRSLLETADADGRVAAADLLRRMDDLSGMDAVLDVLKTGPTAQRAEAARVLGGFRVRAAVDPLLDALMDDDALVRGNALRSLDALWRSLFPYRRLDLVAAGYAAADAEGPRRAAVARIRAWWEAHRTGAW